MKTYWVEYQCNYDYTFKGIKENKDSFDYGRFHCLKKDIKKQIENVIREQDDLDDISNVKIKINDCYITTDSEI